LARSPFDDVIAAHDGQRAERSDRSEPSVGGLFHFKPSCLSPVGTKHARRSAKIVWRVKRIDLSGAILGITSPRIVGDAAAAARPAKATPVRRARNVIS